MVITAYDLEGKSYLLERILGLNSGAVMPVPQETGSAAKFWIQI